MRKIYKLFIALIIILFGLLTLYKLSKENRSMIAIVEYYTREHSTLKNNQWQVNNQNSYVKITNNFVPNNKQDLLNIYYTVLSSGMNEFTFYCDVEYLECTNDIKELTNNDMVLSHINGFIHIYNSYISISTKYQNNGKITIKITRLYNQELIDKIETKFKTVFDKLYDKNKTKKENLKIIHNYIIDNTKYDMEYIHKTTDRLSNTAYAPLYDGYAICSGYTDLMALFLYELDIENIRVSNETHTWNLVYLDGEKLVIDLTYDDPVTMDNSDYRRDTYFLITSEELQKLDTEHYFNEEIYLK